MKGARLGQHFLIHSWAARTLAYAAGVRPGETILEIGPGKGVLTRELLALAPVVAVEKDEALVAFLQEAFADAIAARRLTVVGDDVRNFDPTSYELRAAGYVVAANIPYYITGEIIRQFLTSDVQPRAMALLIQKEVAQRIVSAKESILSISVKAYGTPKLVEKVSRSHFSPPPSVDSAILAITGISKNFFVDVSEEDFFKVVRAGFASKRKFVANNLSTIFDKEKVRAAMDEVGLSPKERAENVTKEQWKRVAIHLWA